MDASGESISSAHFTEVSGQLNLPLWNEPNKRLDRDDKLTDEEIQTILHNLFSEDYTTRQKIIAYLNINQHVITGPLVDLLVKNTTNQTLIFQVTYAIEVIGKLAVPYLIDALNKTPEIKNQLDIAHVENIVETLIRINDKNASTILLKYLQNIKEKTEQLTRAIEQPRNNRDSVATPQVSGKGNGNNNGGEKPLPEQKSSLAKKLEFYQMARIKIHWLMGEMNSSEGLNDLLDLLGDGNRRVPGDVIETLGKIGNKNALSSLIRLYAKESNISELGARYIKETCRTIIKREKLSKSDPIFESLNDAERETFNKILPAYKDANKT
ncbi:MAG: hypothetical protein QME51_00090 [Planctomycetota bacterium]|nr:hypothetical protein [Planctomycetota bacterium]MDI6786758.1 hypothetical protein [Planctomycetota bacterium]